ncbi:hypothetical protein AMV242 [Betaentomopoxvirus amoorei]|uniref:AMV242 n=1 Tax=Amsacta moorei entomopoxvirus TaxID=28321 RepID=Q9EMG4_AMEPV|nr:hypothetical protein AMV242 [Amsacta moorei entomopoxvirus]AAG02948.1 AMV242 [Amsacta moorei entomopoxvirus]
MFIDNLNNNMYYLITPIVRILIHTNNNSNKILKTKPVSDNDYEILKYSSFVEDNTLIINENYINSFTCCKYKIYKITNKNNNGISYKNLPTLYCSNITCLNNKLQNIINK